MAGSGCAVLLAYFYNGELPCWRLENGEAVVDLFFIFIILPVKRMGCLATTYGAIFFWLEMVFNLTVIY